jgi:antitoxin component HigA of HigAB toxin-antitoxin module
MGRTRQKPEADACATIVHASGILLLLLLVLLCAPARAVVVDRIAVVVGDKVITESEIEQRIRLAAFQNHQTAELGLNARRSAAEELINQRLVEREMDVGRYPRIDVSQRKGLIGEYEKSEHADPAGLAKMLSSYGLSVADLEEELGRQSDLLTFLNLRFRPAVQVTDQDIQKYFDSLSNGAGRNLQKAQAGALNEMRDQIEQKLTAERADREMDLWLRDQRNRTRIEFLEKDLEPTKP